MIWNVSQKLRKVIMLILAMTGLVSSKKDAVLVIDLITASAVNNFHIQLTVVKMRLLSSTSPKRLAAFE